MAGISKKASIFPVGFRFDPNDLGLVRRYLRNKVDHKVDGFLTTLDVYADVPWRLEPVDNPLFKKKEWYYFVERIRRGGKTPKRTVPARGDSEGGTWKSTGAKTAIVDGNKKVWGYKQSLVFNKKVKGKPVKTDWLMTEYSLNKDVHDNTVLCWIRDKTEKKGKPGYVDQVPQVANNIVPYQVQEHEVALTVSASGPEMMTLEGEHSQVTQQQHQQDTPNVPHHLPTQVSDFETFMHGNNNNNNVMMTYVVEQYQQPQQCAPIVPRVLQSQISDFETMMHGNNNNHNNVMTMTNGGEQYQYQPHQQYTPIVTPCLQGQDLGYEMVMHGNNDNNNNDNNNNAMMMTDGGEQYRYQHPQQYTPSDPLLQSQDLELESMMHSNNILMRTMYEEELHQQQQQQYAPIVPPPPQSQDPGFATMIVNSNNNYNKNDMMMDEGEQNQQQQQPHDDDLGSHGLDMAGEDRYFTYDELFNTEGGTTEEHVKVEEAQE
ncbi:unnamed protein product [Microthlaspi erraticum]|uniref:NAC domain-containing protein n=1 Tax=Microthlaspi erraticum TaxID=1685480 RepID=A0A6D2IQS1_9BRAS|nr:unnamed protein product [Microthlaspi erraticum]